MFDIYYYIFGLDGKKRWIVLSSLSSVDCLLSRTKNSYYGFGWACELISDDSFYNTEKIVITNLTNKYKTRVYCEVKYVPAFNDTEERVDAMTEYASAKTDLFDHYARTTYTIYKKDARQ